MTAYHAREPVLEFVIVYLLAQHNGKIVAEKGGQPKRYKWLTAGFSFGGEIGGAILGFILVRGSSDGFVAFYAFALTGASAGAIVAWLVAKNVAPNPAAIWRPTHRTPPQGMSVWVQPDSRFQPSSIPGSLPVQLLGQQGGWAMVRGAEGSVEFVDARLLVPLWLAAPAIPPQSPQA